MKVLTVEDKVASVGNENEPTVEVEVPKLTKEELNRYVDVKSSFTVATSDTLYIHIIN